MPFHRFKFIIFLLFLFACVKPQPYVASRAVLEKLQPNREMIPASKGCDICHKIFAEKVSYRYYPIKISHKSHVKLGIGCTFCHRKAATSTSANDYLMPEGHGFEAGASGDSLDKNPCRVCHLYFSDIGKRDRRIPAGCKTCHPAYSEGKPLPFVRWRYNSNLINNHKKHYDTGVPCTRCHVGFDLMEDTTLRFIPKMDICYECHGAPVEKKKIEREGSPLDAARALFLQNCAVCHGAEGKGNGAVGIFFKAGLRPKDLTDHAQMDKRTDRQIHDVILKGGLELNLSERMPAWEGLLTEDEVSDIVKYIRRLSEKPQ